MKALIVYASWFGHNRTVARLIAAELTCRGMMAACMPAVKITEHDIVGYDLLVLGTYTHAGHASQRLRTLCEAIPLEQFDRMEIALFGTRIANAQQTISPSGVDELQLCLEQRGCELALQPLLIEVQDTTALLPWEGLGATERTRIKQFAADLWRASVPEPMI